MYSKLVQEESLPAESVCMCVTVCTTKSVEINIKSKILGMI
jgi:hypothetical protein